MVTAYSTRQGRIMKRYVRENVEKKAPGQKG